jgi:RHS repeat-associated protein
VRLAGQYFDSETGLHQNWLRYYEPRTGRYTQYDRLGLFGSLNGFAYGDGDALNTIDPRGDIAWFLIPLAVKGALAAYARCVLQCGVESAVVSLLMDGCVSLDDVGPCAKDCLNPINWLRIPGAKPARELAKKAQKRPVVIGENMKDRIIPYAKEHDLDYYKPRSKNRDRWMENNKKWMREKIKEGREIIDRGTDPLRKDRSPYYDAEKKIIKKRNYPTTPAP